MADGDFYSKEQNIKIHVKYKTAPGRNVKNRTKLNKTDAIPIFSVNGSASWA